MLLLTLSCTDTVQLLELVNNNLKVGKVGRVSDYLRSTSTHTQSNSLIGSFISSM